MSLGVHSIPILQMLPIEKKAKKLDKEKARNKWVMSLSFRFFTLPLICNPSIEFHKPYQHFVFNRVLAEEELKTNIAETEVFVLPSGQEIEKDGTMIMLITLYINVYCCAPVCQT